MTKELACPCCNFTTDTKRSLNVHIGRQHPEVDIKEMNKQEVNQAVLQQLKNKEIEVRQSVKSKGNFKFYIYTCPHCGHQTQQPNKFSEHLNSTHSIDDLEQEFITHCLNGVEPLCKCGCGKRVTWYGWKQGYSSVYLKGHNAETSMCSDVGKKNAVASRIKFYSEGGKVWNDGLTKETDQRVEKMSEKISTGLLNYYSVNPSWKAGLTAENSPVIAKFRDKILHQYHEEGRQPWNKGLSKHTDSRILEIGEKISKAALSNPDFPRRMKPEELKSKFESSIRFTFVDDESRYQNKYTKFKVQCNDCGKITEKSVVQITFNPEYCKHCAPTASRGQLELYDFVKSIYTDTESEDKTVIPPKELDVYVPSSRIGIEYNGLFYHSDLCIDKDYHWAKTQRASEIGVDLIHIFEDEWRDKRTVVEKFLRRRLSPRQLKEDNVEISVAVITQEEATAFHTQNSLDEVTVADDHIGLTVNGELAACISTLRVSETAAVITNFSLTQHASQEALTTLFNDVFKNCTQHRVKSLSASVDLRLETGALYELQGFQPVDRGEQSELKWWYTDCSRRSSTEELSNTAKIWGCPSRLYIKTL